MHVVHLGSEQSRQHSHSPRPHLARVRNLGQWSGSGSVAGVRVRLRDNGQVGIRFGVRVRVGVRLGQAAPMPLGPAPVRAHVDVEDEVPG